MDGIVLAGGRGRRFGRPKAGVRLGGRSLVAQAVNALARHCDSVVIVARRETPMPLDVDRRVVFDRDGPSAALTAIATGLAALDGDDVLVLACDLIVEPTVLGRLAGLALGEAGVVGDGSGVQPLCGRYPRLAALEACERLLADDDLRARRLPALVGATTIVVPSASVVNVNTWMDAFGVANGLPPRPVSLTRL